MATVSLVMIVKNESDVLARCLDSVCDLMDEVIIVDTGSSDNTKEIAEKYTDKVFDFEWVDDFSAARNFAFSKASCDYIYTADADEVIDEENRQQFKLLLDALDDEVEIVQMKYVENGTQTVLNAKSEYRPKLYKRLRKFTWVDPVHETVRVNPLVFDSDIEILHCPRGEHSARDFSIFQIAYAKEKRLSDNVIEMYAKELLKCGSAQDIFDAAKSFEDIVSNRIVSDDLIVKMWIIIAKSYRLKGEDAAFLKYTTKILAVKQCSEVCLELGEYFLNKGDDEEATIWFYNAAYEVEPIMNILSAGKAPRLGLAQCYANLAGKLEKNNYAIPTEISSDYATGVAYSVQDLLMLHKKYLEEAMSWDVPQEQE